LAGKFLEVVDPDKPDLNPFFGVAFEAQLAIGKVLNYENRIPNCDLIIEALDWAVTEAESDIISISIWCYGSIDGSTELSKKVDEIISKGVIVVTIAGNMGSEPSSITRPGDSNFVITVGATDIDGRMVVSFSGRGPTTDGRMKPEVVAPGSSILTASKDRDGYRFWGGTSFSAPIVAGIGALLKQKFPDLKPTEFKEALIDTAKDIDIIGPDNNSGMGLVDASSALRILNDINLELRIKDLENSLIELHNKNTILESQNEQLQKNYDELQQDVFKLENELIQILSQRYILILLVIISSTIALILGLKGRKSK
jgi:hypothetical protein